jgi:hypothetical protein
MGFEVGITLGLASQNTTYSYGPPRSEGISYVGINAASNFKQGIYFCEYEWSWHVE